MKIPRKSKRIILLGFVFGIFVLILSLPFLPLSSEKYLASYRNTIKLGPYDIEAYVVLSDRFEPEKMEVGGYFTYPRAELERDGCLIEVRAELQNQSVMYDYPERVVGTKHETNFPKENEICISSDETCQTFRHLSEQTRRLHIILYDEPLQKQTYILSLLPIHTDSEKSCTAQTQFTHEIRYHRISAFKAAMSI